MPEYSNYRARRVHAFRAINELERIVDALGVENDPSVLPIPNYKMPSMPSEAVKRELKNQLRATLRLILAHNDGDLSHQEMKAY